MSFIDSVASEQRSTRRPSWKDWPPKALEDLAELVKDTRAGKCIRFPRAAVIRALEKDHGIKVVGSAFRLFLRDNYQSENWDTVLDAKK